MEPIPVYANASHANYFSYENQEEAFKTFIVYAIQGTILINNQEYILAAGLALADSFTGLGCVLAGVGRNLIIMSGETNRLVSRWQCSLKPWNILSFNFCEVSVSMMLFVISADRLFMVFEPMRYFKLQRTQPYALWCVGLIFVGSFLIDMYIVVVSYIFHQDVEFPIICYGQWGHPTALSGDFYTIVLELKIWPATLSVIMYFVAAVMFDRMVKPMSHNMALANGQNLTSLEKQQLAADVRRSRRFTITMGISSVFTLLLLVLPSRVASLAHYSAGVPPVVQALVTGYTYIVNNVNPVLNIFIYTLRHRDIRQGLMCLFRCRKYTAVQ